MAIAKSGIFATALVFAATLFTIGCQAQISAPQDWESTLYADRQLVGKIWDSKQDKFIEVSELLSRVNDSRFLLLGEKHDNPDHHALQQTVLDYYLQQQEVEAVTFEMMDSDRQVLLDSINSESLGSLEELKNYLQWDEEGWDWSFYGPLIKSSLDAAVEISAGNITSAAVGEVYAGVLPAEVKEVLDAGVIEKLEVDIDESHCGLLPSSQFPAMVRVQQSRDYSLAQSLGAQSLGTRGLENNESNTKLRVLIAGNYHIRQDLGVPNYLLAADDSLLRSDIVSLSFQEVDSSELPPAEYLQQFGEVKAFDYIWFTPALSNEDYCASLRSEL